MFVPSAEFLVSIRFIWEMKGRWCASWMDGNCIRPNVTFRNGTQTETVLYDDWNGTAAYNSTFNPNFKKGE